LYVSLVELLPKAQALLSVRRENNAVQIVAILSFFAGMMLMAISLVFL